MSEWATKNLGEIFITKNDKSKQIKSSEYLSNGQFPVIDQSEDFICGHSDDKSKVTFDNLPLTIFGDHTRKVKFVDFPFIAGADGTQILKPTSGINDKFFFYLTNYASERIGNYGYDRHLKHLKEFNCKVPKSEAEQTQIAAVLSCIDRAIEHTEALIAKQQRIKTGLMQDLLTKGIDEHGNIRSEATHEFKDSPLGRIPKEWDSFELQGIAEVIDSLHQTPSFANEGYPMVRVTDIKGGRLDLSSALKVSPSVFADFTRKYTPQKGDIVLSRVGSYGVSSYADTEECFCMGQNTVVIHPQKVEDMILYYVLQTIYVKNQMDNAITGSSQKTLSLKNIKSLSLLFPVDRKEQLKIIVTLKGLTSIVEKSNSHLSKLKSLKQGLMQDLLTGKVSVSGLFAESAAGIA